MRVTELSLVVDDESSQKEVGSPHNYDRRSLCSLADGTTGTGASHTMSDGDDESEMIELKCDEDEELDLKIAEPVLPGSCFPQADLQRSLTLHELKDYRRVETLRNKMAKATKKVRSCIERFCCCCCRGQDRSSDAGRSRTSVIPLVETEGELSLKEYSGVWRYRRVIATSNKGKGDNKGIDKTTSQKVGKGVLGYMMFFPNGYTCINEQGREEAGWRFGIRDNVMVADVPKFGSLRLSFTLTGAYAFAEGWFVFGRTTARRDCTYSSAHLSINGLWNFVQNKCTDKNSEKEHFQIRFNLAGCSHMVFPSGTRDELKNIEVNGHEIVGETSFGRISAEFSHDGGLACAKFAGNFFYGVHDEDGDYDYDHDDVRSWK